MTTLRLRYLIFVICALGGCSVYMESTRPTPVDLAQFDPGDTRTSVMEKIGAPVATNNDRDGMSCDLYRLYTKGYGAAGKVPIAVLESAADFFTIGLAEVVLTPTEAATKNEQHPVWFCYRGDKLVSVTVKDEKATQSPTGTPTVSATPAIFRSTSPTPMTAAPTAIGASTTPAASATLTPTLIGTPSAPASASATPTPAGSGE